MKLMRMAMSWILPVVVGLLFITAGAVKFVGPAWPVNFARWGYPEHFYAVTGVIEVACGIALVVPQLRLFAAVALAGVMVAAVLTASVHGELRFARTAFVYLLLVLAIAWIHLRRSRA